MFARFLLTLPVFFGYFFRFVFIVAVIGTMAFFFGQLLPRKNFDYTAFPFAAFAWEKNGNVYHKIGIQRWKTKVPDMSQYVKSAFRKRITVFRSPEYIEDLIRETCVAEFVHWVLILLSPLYLILMEDETAGWISMLAYVLGNLPFITIQRFNRPRLVMLMSRLTANDAQAAGTKSEGKHNT